MKTSKEIMARIKALGPIVRGSVIEAKRTCGKKNCRCAHGEPHTAFYLSRRIDGKTKLDHIPRDQVKIIRRHRKNYDRLMVLVEQLTTALLRELKEGKK